MNKKNRAHLRSLKIAVLSSVAIVILIVGSFFFRASHVTPILMYHSISEDKDNTLSVSPLNFRRQIEYLNKEKYNVVSMEKLVESVKEGEKLPPKTVVITFDDGFENNFLWAFPLLSKYDMPATIFLITGHVGKDEGYLNWDQIRVMRKNGISFGGHTRNHVYLPSITDGNSMLTEIDGCAKDIMINTGARPELFCYPLGAFNDAVKDVVKRSGYKGACTTNRSSDRLNSDIFALNRIKVTNSDMTKPLHFRMKLSGYYNFFRSLGQKDTTRKRGEGV